jgi:hypothetical protein
MSNAIYQERFYQEIVPKLMLANKISAWPEIMGWWVLCIFFFETLINKIKI